MIISELIKKLEKVKEEQGDIEVAFVHNDEQQKEERSKLRKLVLALIRFHCEKDDKSFQETAEKQCPELFESELIEYISGCFHPEICFSPMEKKDE